MSDIGTAVVQLRIVQVGSLSTRNSQVPLLEKATKVKSFVNPDYYQSKLLYLRPKIRY